MDKELFDGWKTILHDTAGELAQLNSSTEDDFISIASHLGMLSKEAKDVTAMATKAAALLHGADVEENIAALQNMLQRIDSYLAVSEKGFEDSHRMLANILEHLDVMVRPLSGFKKIVKHLKVLGVSTKIESARLVNGDNGFNTLAHDVESLAGIIASKSTDILNKLNGLQSIIDEMLSEVVTEKEIERDKTKTIIESILVDLSSLKEKSLSSSETMKHCEERSSEIAREIGEIVASLQFHDITRQQIEHVQEVIDEWHGKLSSMNGDHGDAPVLSDVCDLEARQLSNSKEELISAVKNVMNHLTEITSKVRHVSQEITSFMKVTGTGDTMFFASLKESIISIVQSLTETIQAVENLSRGIQSVATTLNTLTAFVDEIEAIGTEIELIALNARIKAAHTGMEGAALGVLAEEVKNLSVQGREQTTLISRSLQEIGALATDLNMGTGYAKDETIHENEKMVKEMHLLLDSFKKENEKVSLMLAGMEERSDNLASAIDDVFKGISVHKRVEQALGQHVTVLENLSRAIREQFPEPKTKNQIEYMKGLEARYTMHKERDIHKGYHGLSKEKHVGDNVELF